MACASPSAPDAPLNVWTRKTTTDGVFHPAGPPVDVNLFQLVQPGIEAKNDSGTSLEMGLVTLKLDHRTV